jgi:hypothetical protein
MAQVVGAPFPGLWTEDRSAAHAAATATGVRHRLRGGERRYGDGSGENRERQCRQKDDPLYVNLPHGKWRMNKKRALFFREVQINSFNFFLKLL